LNCLTIFSGWRLWRRVLHGRTALTGDGEHQPQRTILIVAGFSAHAAEAHVLTAAGPAQLHDQCREGVVVLWMGLRHARSVWACGF
jgi:hypothetical protein